VADQTAAARAKEAAARESLEERRGQRQRAFARAQLAELDLPLLPADEDVDMGDGTATTATAGGRSGGKHGSAGKRKRSGSAGAVAVTGGRVPPARNVGWFYEPTILTGVTSDMAIVREECFGPVAAICRVA
jgi:hypothetical protein